MWVLQAVGNLQFPLKVGDVTSMELSRFWKGYEHPVKESVNCNTWWKERHQYNKNAKYFNNRF